MNADLAASRAFRAARDLLLAHADDLDAARRHFRWPQLPRFTWALDWFDVVAEGTPQPALRVAGHNGDTQVSFAWLTRRSDQVAMWLRARGVRRRDPVLVLLGNRLELWEVLLAAIKPGAVVVPTHTTATPTELADRMGRAGIRHVIAKAHLAKGFSAVPGEWTRIAVGGARAGWIPYTDSDDSPDRFTPDGPTFAEDPLFCYFTSGTTSRPTMVLHTHVSYPVGHLTGMYWNGVRPGDAHLNIASPGWAKHSWSSFFVPWNAEATVVALNDPRPTADHILDVLRSAGVSTFCAPPTAWRGLVRQGLAHRPPRLREAVAAGEPLEQSLFSTVRTAWDLAVRDGYGQTETTAQVGNPPGRRPAVTGMGWPLPGYEVEVLDRGTGQPVGVGDTGELCVALSPRPIGVMRGYLDDEGRTDAVFANGYYHTGDLVVRNADGSLTFVGRDDDMFKSFDHRISPLELEHVLLAHPAVAEAAVVPSPHPVGDWEPKAFVVLAEGWPADEATAHTILAAVREDLPEEKWIALVRFVPQLPRTSSGKTRRAALRSVDDQHERVFRMNPVVTR